MNALQVTLLIEDLARSAGAVAPDRRWPSLERAWCRGSFRRVEALSPDHLRFTLFGLEAGIHLPVAALTRVCDLGMRPDSEEYWLRLDPVTMQADMARVFITRRGLVDLDPEESGEIDSCIREILHGEGYRVHGRRTGRWCIALAEPLAFDFCPLDQALGRDVADVLPAAPEARGWRRLLTEMQIALHNAPVNVRRRAAGRPEVNSVWIWGGGFVPQAAAEKPFDAVYADNAVSRGLGIVNDCRLANLDRTGTMDFSADGHSVLIDWTNPAADPEQRMREVEAFCGQLMALADRGRLTLTLYDGGGEGRSYGAAARRRFWRRRKPLSRILPSELMA